MGGGAAWCLRTEVQPWAQRLGIEPKTPGSEQTAQTSRSRTCNAWTAPLSPSSGRNVQRSRSQAAGSAGPIIAPSIWRQLRSYAAM